MLHCRENAQVKVALLPRRPCGERGRHDAVAGIGRGAAALGSRDPGGIRGQRQVDPVLRAVVEHDADGVRRAQLPVLIDHGIARRVRCVDEREVMATARDDRGRDELVSRAALVIERARKTSAAR